MSKVNAFSEEMRAIPSYGVIIERLREVAGVDSDAGLSKWLGKGSTFIATCKNREGISLEAFLPRLNDAEVLYVLRGVRGGATDNAKLPELRLSDAVSVLGSAECFANDVEASSDEVWQWIQGSLQPTPRQLALLFNELAKTSARFIRAMRPESQHSLPASTISLAGGSR